MASVELTHRVEKVVGYPPLRDGGAEQRREFRAVKGIVWATFYRSHDGALEAAGL
jgi:hypothetical protein